ncbi:hypothetical protein TIFTF001_002610 [Ficus carica]|uniref:AB hydrolase-1 domain-containing protein n=1 Tax=Ficus carica TaxID=3494 RepID=A0AA87ZNI4_FICCA|nr:hypothetical protein TIFTF001_002610 [Ficus carica]
MMEKHFVLIHGTCHGAWCWYKLLSLLKLAGHRATALDLGATGVNPKQLNEVTSLSDYVQPLMDFMSSLPQQERVILVGHSYAGLCISLAMESFPQKISVAVFLTAYMPHHKSPPITLMQEDLELAKMLIRPSRMYMEDFSKEGMLTEAKFGSVSRVFVVCEDDEVMKEGFQLWMIENNPTDQEVMVIEGADHMVMLSNPKQLCQCLLKVGQKLSDFNLSSNCQEQED